METKSVITGEFDRSGRYESGLKSLVKSLQWAFALLLVIIIGTLIYFITGGGYFSVEPQQAVIVLRFGRAVETCTTGGHWYLPYPVNSFIRIQTNLQFLNIDLQALEVSAGQIAESLVPGRDNYLLTGDANIVHTSWRIGYVISNPAKYYNTLATPLKPVENGKVAGDVQEKDSNGFVGGRGPQTLLINLFRQAVIQVTASSEVEKILAAGQGEYNGAVQRVFTDLVNAADCGITIDSVTLNRIAPPAKTKPAFDEVTAAYNTQDTLRNQARAYQIETQNDTLARRAEIMAAAETYRKQVVSTVKAESSYFRSINREYQKNPETVLMALYTSALQEAMLHLTGDKFILGTQSVRNKQVRLLLNPEPKNKTPNASAGNPEGK